MTEIERIKAEFGLPPVSQIGVAVWDVDKAVDYYSSIFGIGPFTVYEFVPEKHWIMEELTYSKVKMGKAMMGQVEFELIQPLEENPSTRIFSRVTVRGCTISVLMSPIMMKSAGNLFRPDLNLFYGRKHMSKLTKGT